MSKMFLKKVLLSVLIVSLLSFGLTGCFLLEEIDTIIDTSTDPSIDTCKVWIHLTSTYSDHHYNIYMDSKVYHSNVPVGQYLIENIEKDKYYTFEVIHHKGESFGIESKTKFISSSEVYIYFDVNF